MDAEAAVQARARLALIDGVDRVVIDTESGEIALICHQPVQRHQVADQAKEVLSAAGLGDVIVEVTYRIEHHERARVRFGEMQRTSVGPNVRIDVTLEWGDEEYVGSATGELGSPLELRTAALATLDALRHLLKSDLDVRLAGVKQVRSFDAELIVVSLYAAEDPSRKFVGAVVTEPDALRSAALAVLSALNRVMGNYLSRP